MVTHPNLMMVVLGYALSSVVINYCHHSALLTVHLLVKVEPPLEYDKLLTITATAVNCCLSKEKLLHKRDESVSPGCCSHATSVTLLHGWQWCSEITLTSYT